MITKLSKAPSYNPNFAPVVELPASYPVFDLSSPQGMEEAQKHAGQFGVGRYLEVRPFIYTEKQFQEECRNIHMGIDIGGPAMTPVKCFYEGTVVSIEHHEEAQGYGPVLITEHIVDDQKFWALWGHLSLSSLKLWQVGDPVSKGQVLAHVGAEDENGGWPPHLHFQLSLLPFNEVEFNGVVSQENLDWAKQVYPDPRCVLGPLY